MQRIIQIKNYKIKYTLLIKNVKNLNMRIDKNVEIIVTCNSYVPIEKVDEFVASRCTWIVDKVNEINRKRALLEDKNRYLYLGKSYPMVIIPSSLSGVKIQEGKCLVYQRENDEINEIMKNFEKETTSRLFKKKMLEVYERMVIDYDIQLPTLKIRDMSSRWGSCIPKKNQITLNRQLIHYDESFLEYVVIHEYAHLIQPNHSKSFYRVIEKYMPNYREISKLGPQLIDI